MPATPQANLDVAPLLLTIHEGNFLLLNIGLIESITRILRASERSTGNQLADDPISALYTLRAPERQSNILIHND
jgi:hypothetical protein